MYAYKIEVFYCLWSDSFCMWKIGCLFHFLSCIYEIPPNHAITYWVVMIRRRCRTVTDSGWIAGYGLIPCGLLCWKKHGRNGS